MKYIKFNENKAKHLYELAYEHFQPLCPECELIKKRLEKFLGKKNVNWVKEIIKKYPYDNTI
jgi:hypothetical protein